MVSLSLRVMVVVVGPGRGWRGVEGSGGEGSWMVMEAEICSVYIRSRIVLWIVCCLLFAGCGGEES